MKKRMTLVFLTILPFIVVSIAQAFLPNMIPIHYDFYGEVNRVGVKSGFYVLAGILCVAGLIFMFIQGKRTIRRWME